MTEDQRVRHMEVVVLAACVLLTLLFLVYPIYVIRPFRAQGARELAVALSMMHFRAGIAFICSVVAAGALLAYWQRQISRGRRIWAIAAVITTIVAAVLCRVNVYERMFHPNARPTFTAVRDTRLDGDEKVLSVRVGATARAYPIRSMAYHHVINDVVEQTPIVATY